MHTLSTRKLNQDPLENCFGCVRSNCGCNPNPTVSQFVAALKTSLITNLINNNKNRNCLDDKNDILNNFKTFLTQNAIDENVISEHDVEVSTPCPDITFSSILLEKEDFEEMEISQGSGEMQACAYVCGFIYKNMTPNCSKCKSVMLSDPNTEVCHLFTSFKEYSNLKASLNYVNTDFCQVVENAAILINNYLNENAHTAKIKYNLKKICEPINKDWLRGCEDHFTKNCQQIIDSTIAICIKRFCKIKNQCFSEAASKNALKRKISILKHI